jgi:hypothetical protein
MYKIIDNNTNSGPNRENHRIDDTYEPQALAYASKICEEFDSGKRLDSGSIRRKVQNPKYLCNTCGRAASESQDLCSPEAL